MLVRMLVSTRVRNKKEQQTGSFLGEASKSKSWRNGMLPLAEEAFDTEKSVTSSQ